jgi:hypothetical protein
MRDEYSRPMLSEGFLKRLAEEKNKNQNKTDNKGEKGLSYEQRRNLEGKLDDLDRKLQTALMVSSRRIQDSHLYEAKRKIEEIKRSLRYL